MKAVFPAQIFGVSDAPSLRIGEPGLHVASKLYRVQQILPGCIVRQRFDQFMCSLFDGQLRVLVEPNDSSILPDCQRWAP